MAVVRCVLTVGQCKTSDEQPVGKSPCAGTVRATRLIVLILRSSAAVRRQPGDISMLLPTNYSTEAGYRGLHRSCTPVTSIWQSNRNPSLGFWEKNRTVGKGGKNESTTDSLFITDRDRGPVAFLAFVDRLSKLWRDDEDLYRRSDGYVLRKERIAPSDDGKDAGNGP